MALLTQAFVSWETGDRRRRAKGSDRAVNKSSDRGDSVSQTRQTINPCLPQEERRRRRRKRRSWRGRDFAFAFVRFASRHVSCLVNVSSIYRFEGHFVEKENFDIWEEDLEGRGCGGRGPVVLFCCI